MSAVTRTEQDRLLSIPRDDLYVAVVSDMLDAGGLLNQAMDARLRPLAPGMRLVGRALRREMSTITSARYDSKALHKQKNTSTAKTSAARGVRFA